MKSATALVVDESDLSVIYSKNAKGPMPIASITKLMTALVVLDGKQPLDEVLTITNADRDTKYGSGSRLAVGTKLSRRDLLHVALMSSDNRAAQALGRNYPGGLAAFVKTMNVKAKALEMKTARFVDPTGLSNGNVASAGDLLKLVSAAASDPLISELSTSESHSVRVGKQMLEFRNTNNLVNKADWDISLQKTGYTADAGRCLVMKATIDGKPVVMVLLNSFGKYTRTADARRIRRWMEGTGETQVASR